MKEKEETAKEEVNRLKKKCRSCRNVGPTCWNCKVQARIDHLTDFVLFAEHMKMQGRNPDGTKID